MHHSEMHLVRQLLAVFLLAVGGATAHGAPAKLGSYNVKLDETSVSGISSGAYMAVQFGVAWSSIVRGVGLVGAGPYACAQIPKPGSLHTNNSFTSYFYCHNRINAPAVDPLIARANLFASDGRIDPVSNLAGQRIWMYTGYNDGVVKVNTSDVLYDFYKHYIPSGLIHYKTNQNAGHGMVTDRASHGPCTGTSSPFLNNCNFDAAGQMLNHIHGRLQPRVTAATGTLVEFDQAEFANVGAISMSATGRAYVPATCASGEPCRVHVALHGCRMSHEEIGTRYVSEAGYNEWADSNRIIVVYPQATTRVVDSTYIYQDRNNTEACWDFWGYNVDHDQNASGNENYANKRGAQVRAIKAMLDRISAGYSGWQAEPDGPFKAPPNLHAQDTSHNRVNLVWAPVAGATGYHVYRATCAKCAFRRVTATPTNAASFSSDGLASNSPYFFRVTAVKAGRESPASEVQAHTAAPPPPCDPYLTSNYVHVDFEGFTGESRAWVLCPNCAAYARGSNQYIGLYSVAEAAPLLRIGTQHYVVGTCR